MRATMHLRARRAITALAALVVLFGTVSAAPAPARATALPTATTTTLGPPTLNPKPVGLTAQITATITPIVDGGDVAFFVNAEGSARATIAVVNDGWGSHASWTMPADLAAGPYAIVAKFSGTPSFALSESTPVNVTVGPRPSVTAITNVSGPHDYSGATAQQYDLVSVTYAVDDNGDYTPNLPALAGSVDIKVDGHTTSTFDYPAQNFTDLDTGTWTIGKHTITAEFTPSNANHAASTSAGFDIEIVANQVDATGLAASNPTFYPFKDGYKDTTGLRGARSEAASVAIKVTNGAGKVVKTASVAEGTGSWSVPWNGRTTTGAILPDGKYTVKQTVTDHYGAHRLFTSYVTISGKKLVTSTVALKKSVSQLAKNGSTWFGWTFTVPSATVYKKLVFAVYGKSGVPLGLFGGHNFIACGATWDWYNCMNPPATFPATAGWKSVTGNVNSNRSGRTVRMYAVGGYKTYVLYARVTVTYAVLK